MEACKLQRHQSQHCGTTVKVRDGQGSLGILLSTQTAELAWDWLGITMSLTKDSK